MTYQLAAGAFSYRLIGGRYGCKCGVRRVLRQIDGSVGGIWRAGRHVYCLDAGDTGATESCGSSGKAEMIGSI